MDALTSIHGLQCQRYVKVNHHLHKAKSKEYSKRYRAGDDVCTIAEDVNFPPCVIMRLLLDSLQLGLSKDVRTGGRPCDPSGILPGHLAAWH